MQQKGHSLPNKYADYKSVWKTDFFLKLTLKAITVTGISQLLIVVGLFGRILVSWLVFGKWGREAKSDFS